MDKANSSRELFKEVATTDDNKLVFERFALSAEDPIGKLFWSRMVVIEGAVVIVTACQLLGLCSPVDASITMVVPRRPSGKRMRVLGMPRVLGHVLDRGYPQGTAIAVAIRDIRRCYRAHLDEIEAVAVRLAETESASDAATKWMDEYRQLLEVLRTWSST
jgi:hypothetical protein